MISSLFRLSGFFFRNKILKQKVPLLASVKLLYRCNLSCRVCPYHLRKDEPNSLMGYDTAIRVLDRLKHLGCQIIVFEGGEPLLWQDGNHTFSDLARYAKKKFLSTAVTTNGTLPLDVPTDMVWVSIDGTRETHNRLRSNSYDRVMNNIEKTAHHKVFVHFTANRENYQDLEPLFRELAKVKKIRGYTLQLVYPYHQGEENLCLSRDERKTVIEKALDLKEQGLPVLNSASRLRAMIDNSWKCHDHLLINADPDGSVTSGCYVKNRGEIFCRECGFTPVAEASGALDLLPGSLLAGWKIFLKHY